MMHLMGALYVYPLAEETRCSGDQENANEIPPAINVDVGAVMASARSLLDQEEREVEHLMTSIIENEV